MGRPLPVPLVSVVTPALNPQLDKLERCLACVSNQTYPNVEHVIVDGGSKNGALELIRSYPQVQLLSEPDSGQTDALNKGFFDIAKGQYLVWLNADDVLYRNSIERTVSILVDQPSIGWVYGDLDVDWNGRRHTIRPPAHPTIAALDFNNVGLISPGSTFRRGALERAGPMDTSLKMEMDLDLSLKLLESGEQGHYIPHSLALLEIYPGTKSAETPQRDIAEERHRIYLNHGMFLQAGAALALAGRYEISNQITVALLEGDFTRAREAAAEGLRFMPAIIERHRISFWMARLFPRVMRLIKSRLGRFKDV